MSGRPTQIFSHRFPATIWNTLAVEDQNLIILEVRDDVNFKVTFSAFDYGTNSFRWKDIALIETWWISLVVANKNTVLLNRYLTKGNPDHKSLIALDMVTGITRWEVEELSFFDWSETEVFGYRTKEDLIPVKVNLATGETSEQSWEPVDTPTQTKPRPVFYPEGTAHFETIKKFVSRTDYSIVKGVEYLEFNDWIILSVYTGEPGNLANVLLVFNRAGELALNVKLGEKLAGLGADTFFILSGCLFLVQNKTELVAYRL